MAQIERKLEERRLSEQRSALRRWVRRSVVALGAVAAGTVAWFVLHSSLFSANVVTITGVGGQRRAAVLAVSGLGAHPPLIAVDPGATSDRVAALPWVRSARVERQWPDGVAVDVTVRHPVAVVPAPRNKAPGGYVEVDPTGRVLRAVQSTPAGLVELRVPARPGAVGTWLASSARPGLTVAASLPPALSGLVSAVEVQAHGQVVLQLTSPVVVQLGAAVQLHEKYEDAAALLAGASLQDGDVIDVSVPSAPVVSGPNLSAPNT